MQPIVDYHNPYYTYSVLGNGSAWALFYNMWLTCWVQEYTGVATTPPQETSWGRLKGLFR